MAGTRARVVAMIAIGILVSALPTTSAHDPSTYVVILRSDGPMPANVTEGLYTGDSVMFRDVDSTENVTHRVVMDGDGDGAYDDSSVDWDSGNLTNACELDSEGNKSDPDCEVTFIVTFNGTSGFGAGTYHYSVLSSDGASRNGTIRIIADDHSGEDEGPAPGYSFGEDGDDDARVDGQPPVDRFAAIGGAQTLLVLSATTMLGALYVFARIGASMEDAGDIRRAAKEAEAEVAAKERRAAGEDDSEE